MTDKLRHGKGLLAGQAARELGVGVQTLHYYEREGLIPTPPRTDAGYRVYPSEVMDRLRFIRRAQALGLSLAEIRETCELAEIGESPCGRVQAALAEKLEDVDRRLEELTLFRHQLADLVAHAPEGQPGLAAAFCSIVEGAEPMSSADRIPPLLTRRRASRR